MKKHAVSSYVQIGCILLCIVGICVLGFLMYQDSAVFRKSVAANEKQIADLQAELDGIKETVVSAEDSKVTLNSARALGDHIAELQNQYMTRVAQQREELGDETAFYADLNAISEELDTYFGEGSSFRGSWYMGVTEKVQSTWTFCTNYSFTDDMVPVLWICFGNDELLAYVTGVYHADTNTVDSLVSNITAVGYSYYGVTESDDAPQYDNNFDSEAYANSILEMAESIHAAGDVTVPELTDEELEAYRDMKESQAKMRNKAQGGN